MVAVFLVTGRKQMKASRQYRYVADANALVLNLFVTPGVRNYFRLCFVEYSPCENILFKLKTQ
jgi:hypothetical protein